MGRLREDLDVLLEELAQELQVVLQLAVLDASSEEHVHDLEQAVVHQDLDSDLVVTQVLRKIRRDEANEEVCLL